MTDDASAATPSIEAVICPRPEEALPVALATSARARSALAAQEGAGDTGTIDDGAADGAPANDDAPMTGLQADTQGGSAGAQVAPIEDATRAAEPTEAATAVDSAPMMDVSPKVEEAGGTAAISRGGSSAMSTDSAPPASTRSQLQPPSPSRNAAETGREDSLTPGAPSSRLHAGAGGEPQGEAELGGRDSTGGTTPRPQQSLPSADSRAGDEKEESEGKAVLVTDTRTEQASSRSMAQSASPTSSSPTLTELSSSLSAPSSTEEVPRSSARPRQPSVHTSEETHSAAATPGTNSDEGTTHTSETSSGKSRAMPDDAGPSSLLQKLPVEVVDRIISYVRLDALNHAIPSAVHTEIGHVPMGNRSVVWLTHSWGMSWLFELRRVASNFHKAVRGNRLWYEYICSIAHARRERLDLRGALPFALALKYLHRLCFGCTLNGETYDRKMETTTHFAASVGLTVPLCEVHEAAMTNPSDSEQLCSHCFLDERRYYDYRTQVGPDRYVLRQDVDITYIEDDERFPHAENVCSTCRADAFFKAIDFEDHNFNQYRSRLQRTFNYSAYVWSAEGSASEAAKGAIEQLWLEVATEYAHIVRQARHQKRRDRVKRLEARRQEQIRRRALFKSILPDSDYPSDSDDSLTSLQDHSVDEVRFRDEDEEGNVPLDGAEDRLARDQAWFLWCRNRLEIGLWKSAFDQQDVQLAGRYPARNGIPQLALSGRPSWPGEAVDESGLVVFDALPLPPASLFHRACRVWDEVALPDFFRLPLTNMVDMLRGREDGFEVAMQMDFAKLFASLRSPEVWTRPAPQGSNTSGTGSNATTLASRGAQHYLPAMPASPADVGAGTVARIMELWKRFCLPLGECNCGICRRQKRKRSHDERGGSDEVALKTAKAGAGVVPSQAVTSPRILKAERQSRTTTKTVAGAGLTTESTSPPPASPAGAGAASASEDDGDTKMGSTRASSVDPPSERETTSTGTAQRERDEEDEEVEEEDEEEEEEEEEGLQEEDDADAARGPRKVARFEQARSPMRGTT